jgi:hypothetical protein
MTDWLTLISTVAAGVAALAALATLFVSYRSLREGRGMIDQLKALALEATKETTAQQAIVGSTEKLATRSQATASLLHAVVLEANATRELEVFERVGAALAECISAIKRVTEGQPTFLFFGAKQQLIAALASVPQGRFSNCESLAGSYDAKTASQYMIAGRTEVESALGEAAKKLADASSTATAAVALGLGETDKPSLTSAP